MKIHSFIPWFVIRNLFMCLAMFAAGDAGLAALGGGESSVAVMDGGDEGGGESSSSESEAGGESEQARTEDGEKPVQKEGEQATEGAKQLSKPLSRDAVGVLKGLKESNPKAYKELNARLWAHDAETRKIAEHFPEGLDSAISLKSDIDTFLTDAGVNDLGEIREELNDYRVTDKLIKEGDISFVKSLPEDIQNGIYKMVPQFVDQWATQDNEAYQKYFAGLVFNTMRDTEFTTNQRDAIRLLERMGLDNPDVKEVYDLVKGNYDWIGKLKDKADKPVERRQDAGKEGDATAREKESIRTEKMQLARTRVGTQFRSFADPKLNSTLQQINGGTVPGHVNKAEVFTRAITNLAATLGPAFSQRIDAYLEAGDEAGAIRYARQQATDQRILDSVTKAYTYLYGKPSGKKAATSSQQNNNGRQQGAGAGNGAGSGANTDTTVRAINYNPSTSSIDFKKTDEWARKQGLTRAKLLLQNKAVLKNGHKVTWKHDAPEEGR